jgi:hypothetical protein
VDSSIVACAPPHLLVALPSIAVEHLVVTSPGTHRGNLELLVINRRRLLHED